MSTTTKNLEKKAAEQALFEFRKEHARHDLERAREVLMSILQDPEATRKEKIEAARELNKMHGAHTPQDKTAVKKSEDKPTFESIDLPDEFVKKLNEILGIQIESLS